jgi:hypothetical protein
MMFRIMALGPLAAPAAPVGWSPRSRAPDAPLRLRPALDVVGVPEADQVGRVLCSPEPELAAVAAEAGVCGVAGELGVVREARVEQLT